MKITSNSPVEAAALYAAKNKEFSLSDMAKASRIDRRKLLRVLEKFRKEGFLVIVDECQVVPNGKEVGPRRRDPKYRVVRDISKRKPNRPEGTWKKVWRTIRHLRSATRTDLIRLTGCSYGTVEKYTIRLAKNGHIKAVGRKDREIIWLLINDVGPNPPGWDEVNNGKK